VVAIYLPILHINLSQLPIKFATKKEKKYLGHFRGHKIKCGTKHGVDAYSN
jgi:hypothetical protein